jgi:hypothetical protein
MVKNLNTVERGEKVRIGKVQPPTQAGNTIIVNASDTIVQAPHAGTFVSPIRFDNVATTNVLAYNSTTKEIVTTQVVASDKNLQQVTDTGNETNTAVRLLGGAEFSNLTGLGGNVYVDDTGTTGNVIYARGNVYLEGNLTTIGEATFISSKNISITDPILELGQNNVNENLLYDLGVVMKRPGDNVGIAYREGVDELTFAYTANSASDRYITTTSNLLTMNVVGDVYANAYFGDGRTLTGIAHEVNLVDNSSRVSLLEANLVRVSNLETQMSSNAIRVGNLESNLAANSVRISTLESGLQQNADRITTLYAHHASNVIRIGNLESNLAANAVRITNLEENLEDNSVRISTLSSRLDDNSFRISVNTANIANLEVRTSNNFANIADLQVQLADNNLRITTLETYPARVVNLESNLADNSARITALEVLPAQLQDNSARIAALEVDPSFDGIITGDGGNISNLTLQYISDMGNTTSNTLVLTGSPTALKTTGFVGVNVEPEYELHVAGDTKVSGNIYATGSGTVLNGLNNKLTGNTSIYGNLNVHGATSYLYSENVYIKDPILGIGNNGVVDSGIIISSQNPSNVVFGYDGSATEFIVAHSTDSIDGATLTPDPTNDIDFHVYGDVQAKNITTSKDIVVGGNLTVSGNTTFLNVENLAVEDAIIKVAANNTTTSADTGVVMGRADANVAVVYRGDEDELMLAYTTSDPGGLDIIPDTSKRMNVHVYGSMFVDKTLNVNSNTFITEGGFIYANAFIGDGGLLSNVRTTLQSITDNGANTTHTILFQNTTTGFEVTEGNAIVAGNITVGDMVYVGSEPVAFQRDMDSNTARIVILESNLAANSARTSQLETDRDSNTARIVILESNLAANSARTSQLETDRDSNTARIVILESNLAANSARTSQLETDRDSNTARIVILESNLAANSARTSQLETDRDSNTARIVILESNLAANSARTSQLETDMESNTARIVILESNLAANSARTSQLETDRDSNTARIVILESNLAANSARTSQLETDRDSNTARIVILESNLAANSARTSQLETDRDSNTTRIAILESNLDANSARTSQLETDMESNTARIVILESNLAANSARTSQLETDRDSNTARIVDLESNLAANSARLSTLQSYHESNVIRISDLETTRATRTELATEVFTLNQNIASNLDAAKAYTDTQVEANLIVANNYTDSVAALKADLLDPTFTSNITVTANVTTQTLAVGSLTPGRVAYVGADDFLVDSPNLTFSGTKLDVGGDVELTGNLTVGGTTTFLKTTNTIINDAIVELANNNTSDTLDMGIIMTRPSSNVVVGYRGNEGELTLAHTLSDPSNVNIVPDTANALAVHVYGSLDVDADVEVGAANLYVKTTTGRVGVGTDSPTHTLDVRGTANVATVYADSNVGVKTTTPAYPLDVWGDANVAALNATGLSVAPDTDITGVVGRLKVGDVTGTSDTAGVAHHDYASATGYALYQDASGQTYVNGTNVRFGESGSEKMRLTGGQLGIATTTPEANLHVVGNVYASGNLEVGTTNLFVDTLTGRVGLGTNAPLYELDVHGDANVQTMNVHTIQAVDSLSLNSDNTTTAPLHITAGSLNDGVGALRIDSVEPDIYLNDTNGGDSTIIFADDSNAYVGIGRNTSNNFYITVRDPDVNSGAWRDDTLVADRLTGDVSLGYKLNVAGNVAVATNNLFVDTTESRVGVGTTIPSHTLDVRGAANAATYYGDGGTLSNVTLQGVTTHGNTTSRITSFLNTHTALTTDLTSNVGIKVDQLENVEINTSELVAEQRLVFKGTNWVNEHNDKTFIRIFNDTGGDLNKGEVVYINGSHNQNLANVALAKSDSSATMPAIGVVHETLSNGGEGLAITYGRASGVDTDGISVGQTVYVSNTTAGGVMGTKPYNTLPHLIQNLGVCVKEGSNGSIFVTGIGRANDIPNANVLTSMTGVNYVYVNTSNNDLKKIAPGTLETKVPTLQQVTTAGATTSDMVSFTNTGTWSLTASGNIYAASNITALEYYGDGTKLDGVALQTDLAANVTLIEGLRTDVDSNAGLLSTARDDIDDLELTRATYLDPTFTSNITVNNVAYIETGLVLANTHYYTHSGSMSAPSSNISLQFASNVFYAKVVAQLLHGDEDLNTLVLELQGGHKDGTPTKNITKGTLNKFGDTTYPWSSNVVCTPTEVVIEPHDTAEAYDYDIKVEYTSSGTDAKLESIKEGTTVVKNFAY